MDKELLQLKPAAIWKNFVALNAVPRPSKEEQRVIEFICNFGKSLGLPTEQDEVGNVLIRKTGSRGKEGKAPVVLQSHLDMVHQKNSDTPFDFKTEGIKMMIDGDWVKARGTTLGADNGIGVASMMAILESKELEHPPLEALFTVDEETGMSGAKGLSPDFLKGKRLLNLDTEEDDEIDIGCAGGLDITAQRSYTSEKTAYGFMGAIIRVKGLQGGHSGMDINRGLANANLVMNRVLLECTDTIGIRLSVLDGGGLRNAIPRESWSMFSYDPKMKAQLERLVADLEKQIKQEYSAQEPGLRIILESCATPSDWLPLPVQEDLLQSLDKAPNGVYTMSKAIEGNVESSNNIARVNAGKGEISIGCLARSSEETSKMALAGKLTEIFEEKGFEVSFSGEYPGWQPNPDSRLLNLLTERYKELFGEDPRVVACHAGLECGIIGEKYKEMDMISFGPTIRGAHSPDERVQISSVRKFWKLLIDLLERME